MPGSFFYKPRSVAVLILVLTLINAGSLRTFYKYTPYPIIGFTGFILLLVSIWLYLFKNNRINSVPTRGMLFCLALAVLYIYPIADALKYSMRGSDQDDCVRMLVHNYLSGDFSYTPSYLGNPCSTGPAEFFVYLPVAIWDNFFAVVPCITLISAYFVAAGLKGREFAQILILGQLSCLSFYEISAAGSDFIPIGWAYTIGILLALKAGRENLASAVASIVALAIFSASRTPLFFLSLPVVGILFVARQKRAVTLISFSLIISLGLYVSAYLLSGGVYAPLHLFHKALLLLSGGLGVKFLFLFVALVLSMFLYYHYRSNNNLKFYLTALKTRILLVANASLVIPMFVIALADLAKRNFDFGQWEGANYIIVGLPSLLVMLLDMREFKSSDGVLQNAPV